jgi:hypothetical protein
MPLKGHDPGGVVSVGASRQARHLAGAPPPLHFELARNAPRHASTTGVGLFGVPTGLRNQGPFPALPSRPPRGWSRLLRVWPAAKARLVSCVVWSAALSRASKLDSPLAAEGGPTWPVTKPLALLLLTASPCYRFFFFFFGGLDDTSSPASPSSAHCRTPLVTVASASSEGRHQRLAFQGP